MIPFRTYSQLLDLKNLDPDLIKIEDIAHSLSSICRFNAATPRFYSVAQHSIMCSYLVPPAAALYALLHDAHEYITGDISRPVQQVLMYYAGTDFLETLKNDIDRVIFPKFGVQESDEIIETVKVIDSAACEAEMQYFFEDRKNPKFDKYMQAETFSRIKIAFLARFYELKSLL